MFEIEKGIPLPSLRHSPSKYPFNDMEIGDSFLASPPGTEGAARAAASWASKNGRKFTAGKSDGGVRIWRVA